MRKLIDGLAIASFVLSLTTVGAIGFGYLALTNKTNQEKIKGYAINEAQKLLKDRLTESMPSLPDSTGGVMERMRDMTDQSPAPNFPVK